MCQIRWIDDMTGEPTPDDNPAIGRVRCKQYRYSVRTVAGRPWREPWVPGEWSEWYTICAEHAKQLSKPDMVDWEFEPLAAK